MLASIQKDYSSKIENRVTELVNRIVMEHEERLRSIEELKQNIDIKEKLAFEKTNYEREEMRDRFSQLDSIVRSEF